VSNNEIVRGYEVEKNRFVVVEAKELEEVQEKVADGDRTIEIVQCVDLSSINPLLFEKPYYLAPEKGGNKAYVVLREALRDAKRVGITYANKAPAGGFDSWATSAVSGGVTIL
jgi:DNA end-binding protein Ku